MLVYIAFRFEWIYGLGAVIACFHDTIITIGSVLLFNKEISLTVIAALLTLVGYSMNDTIVIFDRIRENLKIHAPRAAGARDEQEREPDVEPDRDDLGPDVPDRDRAVPVRRSGAARIFVSRWCAVLSLERIRRCSSPARSFCSGTITPTGVRKSAKQRLR